MRGFPRRRACGAFHARNARRGEKPVFHSTRPLLGVSCRSTFHRAFGIRDSDAAGAHCTTQRSHTHNPEVREVLYRWHPLCGRRVGVIQILERPGTTIYRCSLDGSDDSRTCEIPQWMFDVAACQSTRAADSPEVDISALLDLRTLLSSVRLEGCRTVRQAEHHSLSSMEGANAKRSDAGEGGPTEPVPPTPGEHPVGDFAEGESATERSSPGAFAARVRKKPVPRRRQGARR